MNFITLQKPKRISFETSIKKDGYYRVFNFEKGKKTKCFYMNNEITVEECIDMIQIEGIECRLYTNGEKIIKTSKEYNQDNRSFFGASLGFLGVAIFVFAIGEN